MYAPTGRHKKEDPYYFINSHCCILTSTTGGKSSLMTQIIQVDEYGYRMRFKQHLCFGAGELEFPDEPLDKFIHRVRFFPPDEFNPWEILMHDPRPEIKDCVKFYDPFSGNEDVIENLCAL